MKGRRIVKGKKAPYPVFKKMITKSKSRRKINGR